eukprot:SAG31_NODE_12116_length_967_cov_1.069124_2_plen_174_part_00
MPTIREIRVFIARCTALIEKVSPCIVFETVEKYRLKPESGEAERISVDHISRAGAAGAAGGASALTTQLGGMKHAISMLHERIAWLQQYLAAVQAGKLSPNRSVLREISSLCSRLPIKDPQDFFIDYNDTLLVTYLCSITQCANSTNELLEKFTVEHDRRGTGGPGGRSKMTR